MEDRASGFRLLEHPSDVGIEAFAPTLGEAFAAAGRGLMSIILDPAAVDPCEAREISLQASDVEQLLVRWLSEILYLYDGGGFASREFAVDRIGPAGLHALVRGERFDPQRHSTRMDVKAVTYHQLAVRSGAEGWVARVFLDI